MTIISSISVKPCWIFFMVFPIELANVRVSRYAELALGLTPWPRGQRCISCSSMKARCVPFRQPPVGWTKTSCFLGACAQWARFHQIAEQGCVTHITACDSRHPRTVAALRQIVTQRGSSNAGRSLMRQGRAAFRSANEANGAMRCERIPMRAGDDMRREAVAGPAHRSRLECEQRAVGLTISRQSIPSFLSLYRIARNVMPSFAAAFVLL